MFISTPLRTAALAAIFSALALTGAAAKSPASGTFRSTPDITPAGYYGGGHVGVYIGGYRHGYRHGHRRWRWRVRCHRHKLRVPVWNGHRWVKRWRLGRRHCHRVRVYY